MTHENQNGLSSFYINHYANDLQILCLINEDNQSY